MQCIGSTVKKLENRSYMVMLIEYAVQSKASKLVDREIHTIAGPRDVMLDETAEWSSRLAIPNSTINTYIYKQELQL